MMVPVSVLIITYNEERNIRGALDSVVAWAREIFVVDSHSTDRTVEICEQHRANGVRVWQHPFENYAAQRNWALDHLPWTNDWVLVLDADERVTPELREEIGQLMSPSPPCDGYLVKFRFVFLGRWLRHASTYPVWILRLFRRTKARYRRSVNEYVELDGTAGRLTHDLIHDSRSGLAAWIQKHNVYSSREAEEYCKVLTGADDERVPQLPGAPGYSRRQELKKLFIRLPFRPLVSFLYMYVWKRGFLDGRPGLIFCALKAIQEFHISCKMHEKRTQGPTPASAGHAPEARTAHGECPSMTVPYVPVDHEGWVA